MCQKKDREWGRHVNRDKISKTPYLRTVWDIKWMQSFVKCSFIGIINVQLNCQLQVSVFPKS